MRNSISNLSLERQRYIAAAPDWSRDELTSYLINNSNVAILLQDEIPEVGRYAVCVENTAFWIGCAPSLKMAKEMAKMLDLKIISTPSAWQLSAFRARQKTRSLAKEC